MNIKFKKRVIGCYNIVYEKDSVIDYKRWDNNWRGMSEQERVEKGVFAVCYGHGEFDVFDSSQVEVVK